MSNEAATAWLETIVKKHGLEKDVTDAKDVRPSEVISGSSGVQYSYGENTYEGAAEGGDFADKARENAATNDHDSVGTGYKEGSNPMQSANLGDGNFVLRYGIGFLCWDYPKKSSDLADIRDKLATPTNAYKKGFKGMHRTKQYVNPKGGEILSKIAAWIKVLNADLKGAGTGELVVSFQGHGDGGSIFGVDWKEIKTSDMLALAKAAESKSVSITYMLDACFTGNAVPDFQDHASDSVDKKIDKAEGAGNVCSEENTARANALRDEMAHARELILFSKALGAHGKTLFRLISDIESKNDIPSWDAAMNHNTAIINECEAILTQFKHNFNIAARPEMKLENISQALEHLIRYLNSIEPQTCFEYSDWTGAIGKCQDKISDGANLIIKLIHDDLKALGV